MAELQLSVVSDPNSKRQIELQINQWEDNLERLHCEQFRLRCYMASLQNGELPNPKVNTFKPHKSTSFFQVVGIKESNQKKSKIKMSLICSIPFYFILFFKRAF